MKYDSFFEDPYTDNLEFFLEIVNKILHDHETILCNFFLELTVKNHLHEKLKYKIMMPGDTIPLITSLY